MAGLHTVPAMAFPFNSRRNTMSAINRWLVGGLVIIAAVVGAERTATAQIVGRGAPRPVVRGTLKAVDVNGGMITVSYFEGRPAGGERASAIERSYPVSKNVEVIAGDDFGRRGIVAREAKLSDLTAGDSVTLTLSADQAVVEAIVAEGPLVRGTVKSVDTAKNSLTISGAAERRDSSAVE